jgi:hypothetical protein
MTKIRYAFSLIAIKVDGESTQITPIIEACSPSEEFASFIKETIADLQSFGDTTSPEEAIQNWLDTKSKNHTIEVNPFEDAAEYKKRMN